jgi:elongator complex protein 1
MYKETVKKYSGTAYANVLISGLQQSTLPRSSVSAPIIASAESKINRICEAFLRVLEKRPRTSLQNIITAHVCKSPPDLDGGLRIIAKLKGRISCIEISTTRTNSQTAEGEDTAERAAEHICFLADVNQLYDQALGIYDLDVAILIAQQSQKACWTEVP